MSKIVYGSVCSGIEAATAAWEPLGWKAAWYSEIEKFPSAVLSHHYPETPNLGDMTTLKERLPKNGKAIDLLVGGTPCQSFSVAGLRKGLDDPRGNLCLVFLGILDHLRPRWVVWENVPGVLSSNEGKDFGAFLGGLGELGYGFAYRVLDAQYFGVPQRRRRLFVVGYLGDWRRAAAVLFERASLSGDSAPSREARKGTPEEFGGGVELCGPLSARDHKDPGTDGLNHNSAKMIPVSLPLTTRPGSRSDPTRDTFIPVVYENHPADSRITECGDVGPTVTSRFGTGGGNVPLVKLPIAFGAQNSSAQNLSASDRVCPTLDKSKTPAIAIRTAQTSANGHGISEDTAHTLDGSNGQAVVGAFKPGQGAKSRGIGFSEEVSPTLESAMGGNNKPAIVYKMAVRRFTPRECERLQGFEDDYTRIPYRGGYASDAPRYKSIGNSMARVVMEWLGRRVELVDGIEGA